ncbi:MAG: thiamine pyrophosphate-binding protein, partial [Anaerolineae bacterium]
MQHFLSNSEFRRQYRTPALLADDDGNVFKAEDAAETIASYLNKRLYEIGVRYVFAIPGDYIAEWVETLDDSRTNPPPHNLTRVHPNNEMCAAYAADGYGRANSGGVGCVSFTYGVGALNAVQAVAGAFVESSPLVAVNGSPSIAQFNSQRDQGLLWHHMFDGSYTDLRVYENVTAMAVRIDNPATGPDLIDAALRTCITLSKPVYIEIATQTENLPCRPVPPEPLRPAPVPQDSKMLDDAVTAVLNYLESAKKLVVLGGVEIARFGLQEDFAKLCRLLQAPYLSSLLGKSILSEYRDDVCFSGVFNGKNSQENVKKLMGDADYVLSLGVYDTDFNFSGLSQGTTTGAFDLPENFIEVRRGAVK